MLNITRNGNFVGRAEKILQKFLKMAAYLFSEVIHKKCR